MKKSIRLLSLSTRLIKKLERNQFFTMQSLLCSYIPDLGFTEEEESEVELAIHQFLHNGWIRELINQPIKRDYHALDKKYQLSDFPLPLRVQNILTSHAIINISQLVKMIDNFDIIYLEGFGNKTALEVIQGVRFILKNESMDSFLFQKFHPTDRLPIETLFHTPSSKENFKKFNIHTLGDIRHLYFSGEIFQFYCRKTLHAIMETYRDFILNENFHMYPFTEWMLIKFWFGSISFLNLKRYIREMSYGEISFDIEDYIKRISKTFNIVIEEKHIRLKTFKEKLQETKMKIESKEILESRFQGNTLQVIAEKFDKTKERIRQIIKDRVEQFHIFYEAAFTKEFRKYNWCKKIFKMVYSVDDYAYQIIQLYSKKDCVDRNYEFPVEYINELNRNPYFRKIDLDLVHQVREEDFPPKIEIYGKSYPTMSKKAFLEFVIEHYVPSYGLHKMKILKLANRVAKENSLCYVYDQFFDTVTNIVVGYQNIRFYDYEKVTREDRKELKSIVYEVDAVYSMKYFYLKYPNLMRRLDIYDGYELHSILRKLFADTEEFQDRIDFNRQPMLAKTGLTIYDMIEKEWRLLEEPVNIDLFSEKLVEEYGYHSATLLNNINEYLSDYISLKTLYLEKPVVKEEILFKMKKIMKDDFYELKELENIFLNYGIRITDYTYFSTSWLQELGYKTHDINYVMKKEYHCLKEILLKKILSQDIYILTEKDYKIKTTTLIMFLEMLREEYLAFPGKVGKVYTMKYLKKQGINEKELRKYVDALEEMLEPNQFFTYFYLKKNHYEMHNPIFQKIEDYHLPEEVMNDLIRNVKSVKKSTKGDLYCVTNECVVSKKFVGNIKEKYHVLDMNEINQIMKDDYGVSFRKIQEV